MKKIMKAAWIFAVSALVLSSCAEEKNLVSQNESADMISVGITAGSVQSKTYYDGSSQIKWNTKGERLKIIQNAVGLAQKPITEFFTQEGTTADEGLTAKFQANVKKVEGATSFQYSAYYPTDAYIYSGTVDLKNYKLKLRDRQNPLANSFDPKADLLVSNQIDTESQATKLDFTFKRPLAVMKMTLSGINAGEIISEVEITSASSVLAGHLSYDFETGNVLQYGIGEEASHTVTCSYFDGLTSTGSDVIYFTIFPTAANNPALADLSIKVTTDANVYKRTIEFTQPKTVKPNSLVKFTVDQLKPVPAYISTFLTEQEMKDEGITFNRNDEFAGDYTAEQGYELTYTYEGSENVISFNLAEAYDHYDVIPFMEQWGMMMEQEPLQEAEKASFWLTLNTPIPENPQYVTIPMNPAAIGDYAAQGIIVFYGADPEKALAAIYCKYDAPLTPDTPTDELVTAANPADAVTALAAGDPIYDALQMTGYATDVVYEFKTNRTSADFIYAGEHSNLIRISTADGMPDYSGKWQIEGTMVGMTPADSKSTITTWTLEDPAPYEDHLIIIFNGDLPVAAVHFIYDPEFAGLETEAPISFAFPDMVGNATLEPYTGDMSIFMADFPGLDASKVMQLT